MCQKACAACIFTSRMVLFLILSGIKLVRSEKHVEEENENNRQKKRNRFTGYDRIVF